MRVRSPRFRVSARTGGLCGTVVALLLLLTGGAFAAAPGNVVPVTGTVAGHGYAYWLARSWQRVFDSSAPVDPCQTLRVNHDEIAYLTLETIAPGTDRYTCSEPAGRPIYAIGLSNECSTFPDDHGSFGTSGDQLRRCAREEFAGATQRTAVDDHPVEQELVTATRPYHVRAAPGNILSLGPGDGRSAAYGFGLLLTGFEKGTHVIHIEAALGTSKWNITFIVHVG